MIGSTLPTADSDIRLLVAGVGNIFLGDDGFGVEVVRRLQQQPWPEGVWVRDFGIRAFDLEVALERADAAILVDAVCQGMAPGTVSTLRPDLEAPSGTPLENPHSITPERVLGRLSPESLPEPLVIVGCEPSTFGPPGVGQVGLSPVVQQAIEPAVAEIGRWVTAWRQEARDA